MKRNTRSSRREFLGRGGKIAAGTALAAMAAPPVHAAENNTIRLALIGCGGRGSGAVGNAMESPHGPVKLIAMADVIQRRLTASHKALSARFGSRIDVPAERQFIGFDAYRKAIDCLGPGDVAMLTGYAGFRPVQLEYAVGRGVNVFMEKSFATDPPAARRVIRAGEAADKKNLKIAAGLMCRHSVNRQELIKRIRDGELGDVLLSRAYRMGPVGPLGTKPPDESELLWQFRNFIRFYWVSGGLFAEMDIHQIDELCWIHDALPVTAHGVGGRAADSTDCSQNLDSFSVEWTFADGSKATDVVRYLPQCHNEFATYVHGTKCAAQFSGNIHAGTVRIYKDQRIARDNVAWEAPKEQHTAWQAEWDVLLSNIRNDRPQNEAVRAAESNLADMMGRAAVHSGKVVTWDEITASTFQFCPGIDTMDYDTPPPLKPDAAGRYPVPVPGIWSEV
ncbi:MAG: Gfo/Idh/MocA family oxidoreductase [Candidatus Nealsonbacteria bacterium]|nr:Gfo/Idh/MocA family oxidoreductase [Candidatus Nealsonbacteria bacterium]